MTAKKPVHITLTREEATELRDFLTGSGKLTYTKEGLDLFHVVQKLDHELSGGTRGRP